MTGIKHSLLFVIALILFGANISAQRIKAVIHSDGSFDIAGTSVKIANGYPALDNRPVKPVSVQITDKGSLKTIRYLLREGMMELQFAYEGEALTVNTKVTGQSNVPGMISILRDAEVWGAGKVYKTSSQIMGNGGIKAWPDNKAGNLSCSGITGLIADSGHTMTISTRNFKKYNGYTNVYTNKQGRKSVEVCVNTEKVSVANIPTFYFKEKVSAFDAMKDEAMEVAKASGVKNEKPQSYHWCSWYYAYYYLTDKMLSEFVQGVKKMTPPVNIQTIQIDAGYHPHVGDWLEPSEKFPNGIQASVKEILANGYKAGIWIGPYMVGNRSKLYLEHPDWILRYKNNKPVIEMSFYGENRLWGAMDEEIYCLDTSNPEVMAYLRNVFRAFKKMGISFYKTDFMLYGSKNSGDVIRFTPGKTSLEYQSELFDMIRQEIGQESFWLGCIAPFGPMLGYVDAMRISADMHPDWAGGTSMFEESKGAQHINNVWWQNDPDAMILRDKYTHLSDGETRSQALWMGMLGGVINTSDLFYEIPKRTTELFRFLEPGKTKFHTTFPFINSTEKLEVLVRRYSDKASAVFFLNRKDEQALSTFSVKSLVGLPGAYCFVWDENGAEPLGLKNDLQVNLKPHESRVIYISVDNKSPAGMTLGGKQK
jgi:hypothetical protein